MHIECEEKQEIQFASQLNNKKAFVYFFLAKLCSNRDGEERKTQGNICSSFSLNM